MKREGPHDRDGGSKRWEGRRRRLAWSSFALTAVCVAAGVVDELAAPRARLASASPRQIALWRDDFRTLQNLPESERRRIDELRTAIAAAPDAAALDDTMVRFTRWLDTLTPAQRKQFDDATTIDDKMRAVETLIRQQNAQLLADTRKLREHESLQPEGALRRFGLPQLRAKEWQEKINGQLAAREKGLMRDLVPRERGIYSMLLAINRKVVPEPQTIGILNGLLPPPFESTSFYRRTFGGTAYGQLPLVDRERLVSLLLFAYELPPVEARAVFAAYKPGDVPLRLYGEMMGGVSAKPFALVYYFDHLEKLASEQRSAFEKLLKPGLGPARDEVPSKPLLPRDLKDKAKRLQKKPKGEKNGNG